VRDSLPQSQQYRPHPLKVRSIATDHDCQTASLRPNGAARDRGIKPTHATQRGKLGGHFTRCCRFQAGKIHQ